MASSEVCVVSAMKIQVSEMTKTILDEFGVFDLEFRHVFEYGAKKINSYWLKGLKETAEPAHQ